MFQEEFGRFTYAAAKHTIVTPVVDLIPLVNKVKRGNKDAYGRIYIHYYPRISKYCRFKLNGSHQAEDICQDTFVKAWKALATYYRYTGGSMQAFFYTIARNLIIDHYRKKKCVPLEAFLEIPAEDMTPEEKLQKAELVSGIRDVLGTLKDEEQAIIKLRYFDDMPFRDAARKLEMNETTLRVKTHRVLKKLKGILKTQP